MRQTNKPQSGFTLLEIMVAVAILAISLTALSRSVGTNIRTAAYLRDKTFAHWVAMNKMAELQLASAWPNAGTDKGTSELGGNEWGWIVRVSETPNKMIRRADIEVYQSEEREEMTTVLVGYLHHPEITMQQEGNK